MNLGSLAGIAGKKNSSFKDYLLEQRIPVLFPNDAPAMPTKISKAIRLIREKKATLFKTAFGFLCLRLKEWPKTNKIQKITLGLDPGNYYTGIGIQSRKNTLLGIHLKLPVLEKELKNDKKSKKEIKTNRMYEIEICENIMNYFPIDEVIVEISKTKKVKKDWNPMIVGQYWQLKKLSKMIKIDSIDGVQTAHYRKILNFYKQKKKKCQSKPETQVVDGLALAAIPFISDHKIDCKITKAPFIFLEKQEKTIKRGKQKDFKNTISQIDYSEALRVRDFKNEKFLV